MRSIHWIALPLFATMTTACAAHRPFDGAVVVEAPAIKGAPADPVETAPQTDSPLTSNWPGFRGEARDGVYRGAIRVSWEELTPLWKRPIGGGRASFAVAGSRAFTIEQREDSEVTAA